MATKEQIDPRQAQFLALYVDPKSETYSNALQSALKAGYAQEYAENITHLMPDWLSEKLGSNKMLNKAERNLDEFLDLDPWITHTNSEGEEYQKYSTETLKTKADITKFVASTVGKAKYGLSKEGEANKTLIINITGETASRYGILPKE